MKALNRKNLIEYIYVLHNSYRNWRIRALITIVKFLEIIKILKNFWNDVFIQLEIV